MPSRSRRPSQRPRTMTSLGARAALRDDAGRLVRVAGQESAHLAHPSTLELRRLDLTFNARYAVWRESRREAGRQYGATEVDVDVRQLAFADRRCRRSRPGLDRSSSRHGCDPQLRTQLGVAIPPVIGASADRGASAHAASSVSRPRHASTARRPALEWVPPAPASEGRVRDSVGRRSSMGAELRYSVRARRTSALIERSSARARCSSAPASSSGTTAEIFVTVPLIGEFS